MIALTPCVEEDTGQALSRDIVNDLSLAHTDQAVVDLLSRQPVSYTHLDVYKRQLSRCCQSLLPTS